MKIGSLKHILKRHGENGVHDHSMANAADIAQIPFVLENYDKVEPVLNTAGKQVTSHDFKLANGDHAPLIKYTLNSNDRFVYVVEAVTDGKANVVWVTDAYAQPIKKEGGQVLDAANAALSSESSETMLDSYNRPSSNSSISEIGEEVKEQDLDKKRTDNWLEARRLQLPMGLTNYGPIRNVTYSGEDVKEQNLRQHRTNGFLSVKSHLCVVALTFSLSIKSQKNIEETFWESTFVYFFAKFS